MMAFPIHEIETPVNGLHTTLSLSGVLPGRPLDLEKLGNAVQEANG